MVDAISGNSLQNIQNPPKENLNKKPKEFTLSEFLDEFPDPILNRSDSTLDSHRVQITLRDDETAQLLKTKPTIKQRLRRIFSNTRWRN